MSGVVHPIKTEETPNSLNTVELFPTPVCIIKNNNKENKKELAFLTKREYLNNTGNQTSVDNYVLNNTKVSGLSKWIRKAVEDYFAEIYRPKHNVGLTITQSWVNKTPAGGFHHKHAHSNSLVSGVYYLEGSQNDRIYFGKENYMPISVATDDHTPFNSQSWWLPAIKGTLILFPSSITHWVEPVKEKTRYSLSFNTFPSGILGDKISLTELKV